MKVIIFEFHLIHINHSDHIFNTVGFWGFGVLDMDGNRVDKVLVVPRGIGNG